jgi:ParB/RepB/Spo0J family partition protein
MSRGAIMKNVNLGNYVEIPVNDIVYESNRKNGGWGNIEILAESIKSEGLINPPTVIPYEDGTYRVIAGRRRIEAVRRLKWELVPVRIIDADDEERLESIALSENVNRQEMNPLDEAELFKKLLDKGTDIKEMAALYDRSISGIHHRVRLCNLDDELKKMFLEERINLSGAALLAGLPARDQRKFAEKFNRNKLVKIYSCDITDFIHKTQSRPIACIADEQCKKCKERTNNTEPGLFDDFKNLHDVCFNSDCYAGKWKNMIGEFIARENSLKTENNIMLDGNIPKFVPAKAETLVIGGIEYNLLPYNYNFKETSKKAKKDTAWLVTMPSISSIRVEVRRIEYKIVENQNCNSKSVDLVKKYSIDTVTDIAVDDQKAAAGIIEEKYGSTYDFINHTKKTLLDKIIEKRIKEKSRENLAAEYIKEKCFGEEYNRVHNEDIFTTIFSPVGISKYTDIPAEQLIQKIFLFIMACVFKPYNMPDVDYNHKEWEIEQNSIFWKFAQMTWDEYVAMYHEVATDLVMEAGKDHEK